MRIHSSFALAPILLQPSSVDDRPGTAIFRQSTESDRRWRGAVAIRPTPSPSHPLLPLQPLLCVLRAVSALLCSALLRPPSVRPFVLCSGTGRPRNRQAQQQQQTQREERQTGHGEKTENRKRSLTPTPTRFSSLARLPPQLTQSAACCPRRRQHGVWRVVSDRRQGRLSLLRAGGKIGTGERRHSIAHAEVSCGTVVGLNSLRCSSLFLLWLRCSSTPCRSMIATSS
jgi:hypothetical protein